MMGFARDILCIASILLLQVPGHSCYGDLPVIRPNDNKTYFLTPSRVRIQDSEQECIQVGGKHVIIKTNEEFDSFAEAFSGAEFYDTVFWLNVTQIEKDNVIQYYWRDEELNSSYWFPNTFEPNRSGFKVCQITEVYCIAARRRYKSIKGTPDTPMPRLIDTCCDVFFPVLCEDVDECQCKNGPDCLGIPYKCDHIVPNHVLNNTVQCFNDVGTHHCVLYSPTLTPLEFNVSAGGDVDLTCAYYLQSDSPTIFLRIFKDDLLYDDNQTITDSNSTTWQIRNFNSTDVGAYKCTVVIKTETGEHIESGQSNVAELNVNPPPRPNLVTVSPLVSLGDNVTLSCNASDPRSVSEFRWTLNNSLIARSGHSNYDITDFSIENAGLYGCLISVANVSSEESEPLRLRLNFSTPVLTANATSCQEGDALSLTCSNLDDVEGKIYSFMMDGTTIFEADALGVDNQTVILHDFGFNMQGDYTCTVRVRNEESYSSNPLYLMVKPLLSSSSTRIQPGLDTVLKCQLSVTEAATSVWYKDGIESGSPTLPASNSSMIADIFPKIISDFGPGKVGNYTCKIRGRNKDSFESDALYLTLAPLEPPVLSVTREGASVNLTCHSPVPTSKIFFWKKDGVQLMQGDSLLVIPFFNSSREEHYSCSVKVHGKMSNFSNVITLETEVDIASSSLSIAHGSNVQLTCSASLIEAQSYNWLKDGQIFRVDSEDTITLIYFKEQQEGNYSCQVQRNSDGKWIESSSIELKYTLSSYSCPCQCSGIIQGTVTEKELQDLSSDIEKNLTIDPGTLSSSTRKKTSAKDNRMSSTSLGLFAISFMTLVFGSLAISDSISVIRWIWVLIKSRFCQDVSNKKVGDQTCSD